MKYRTALISALVVLSGFIMAVTPLSGFVPPYLDGFKTSSPSVIFADGLGVPDEAQVQITVTGEGDPLVSVFPQDVVFVIDSSGSMHTQWPYWIGNDDDDLRLDAAKYYVDQLDISLSERAAVVDFDDNAILVGGDHLSTNYADIKANIDTIDAVGGTNIPAGMEVANDELTGWGWSSHVSIVILLTDGQNYPPDLDYLMDEIDDFLIAEAINNDIT
ncbi:MAG: VWA domain-containing protein, partial [Thermoplasmata archaeon]|nr:VWA domain-containing protein [Thermoplasmata archaeon]